MRRPTLLLSLVGLVLVASAIGVAFGDGGSSQAADRPVRILAGSATSLDPAAQSDATSASIVAQVFETLTTFDTDLALRPALADTWQVEPGGMRVTFHLRDDLAFSDGTPLRASDVVRSWLRIVDPDAPSPLATFLLVVRGAQAYLDGDATASDVGLIADDGARTVTVEMATPASDFVDVVASPTFAVVPPTSDGEGAFEPGPAFVASGGYVPTASKGGTLTLTANDRYWDGRPEIGTIELVEDTAGRSPVELFEDGDLDYTPVSVYDATWIAWDEDLGPRLRTEPSMSVQYYGFDTSRPPFDDVRVRQAFGMAVDWRRVSALAAVAEDAAPPPTSMVPPGIPGRSDRDFLPPYDPEQARSLLADAGFPGGAGFPQVTIVSSGSGYDAAIADQVREVLGIDLGLETAGYDYYERLLTDPPAIWTEGWVADYPGRNDFLGVLLGSGAANNFGRWSSTEFDDAIAEAAAAADPALAAAAYDRAEGIVGRDVPVVPIAYGGGWALSRDGLLGAGQNGLGIIRMAGLAWAD